MRVDVVIPVFGDPVNWMRRAYRAEESVALAASGVSFWFEVGCKIVFEESLFLCRNRGAQKTSAEWLCFLDADDELAEQYFSAMRFCTDRAEVIVPSIRPIDAMTGATQPPFLIPKTDLLSGNFCPVSCLIQRSVFEFVGGFRDLDFYEDWDLFIRLHRAGARFLQCPDAVLKVHQRPGSRNNISKEAHSARVKEFQELYR